MEACQSPVYWNSLENCRLRKGSVGSNPTASSKGNFMKSIVGLFLFAVVLVGTGEVLDCVMFTNPHKTWCDNGKWAGW